MLLDHSTFDRKHSIQRHSLEKNRINFVAQRHWIEGNHSINYCFIKIKCFVVVLFNYRSSGSELIKSQKQFKKRIGN